MIAVLLVAVLAAEPADVAVLAAEPADVDYVTALDAYVLAQVMAMHGNNERARAELATALAARDRALQAYRQRPPDVVTERRIQELADLDRPCCSKTSLAQRLGMANPP